MTIYIRDVVDDKFIRLVPAFIVKRILDKAKGVRVKNINNYLIKNFNVSLEEIIYFLRKKGFSINKTKNLYTISINRNVIEPKSELKLDSLVRLIDYGNSEILGINLIKNSMDYIAKNILNIYRFYQMKREEEK